MTVGKLTAGSRIYRPREGALDEWIEEIVDTENMINHFKAMIFKRAAWRAKYIKIKREKMKRIEKMLKERVLDA